MASIVEEKSFAFAVRIVRLSLFLRHNKKEYELSKQILRAGTSVGANISEAQQAQSKADFVSKMSIALKEAVETDYWIRLLYSTGFLTENGESSLLTDCREIERMLTAILRTSKD